MRLARGRCPRTKGKWDLLLAARRVDALWELRRWAAAKCLLALSVEALTDPGWVDPVSPLPPAVVGLQ